MIKENKSKTYFLATLGCPKNEIDSEAIEADLISAGLEPIDDSQSADLLIVNSCGFINDAKIETIDTILNLHQGRKKGSVLIMCGCLPARYDLARSFDEVDIFLPWNKHGELISRLQKIGWDIGMKSKPWKRLLPNAPFAYLRISEGCDNRCAYCAIPDIKGPFTSRPLDEIIKEGEFLCENGVRELVLIGQDTTLYGKNGPNNSSLAFLLDKLAEIKNCEWIRLMYAHPAHVDNDTISAMERNHKVVKYIDLPLQHINDRLLGLMNRKVTRYQVETLIDKLRREIPDMVLRTTFIVGFPGESDTEFCELLDFCEATQFDNVGVFKYSPEDGTPAFNFPGRINKDLIEERYLTLLDIQNMISARKLNRFVNQRHKVLLHSVDSAGIGYARAWFQAPEVDGQVMIQDCKTVPGRLLDVVIERSDAYDLYARPLDGR